MYKKLLFFSCIVIGITIMFFLMTETWYELQKVYATQSDYKLPFTKLMLWGMFIGIFIEWNGLKNIIKGNVSVNLLLIPTIILLVVVFIPSIYWEFQFGLGGPFYMKVLKIPDLHIILSVLTGILLVRSLSRNKN